MKQHGLTVALVALVVSVIYSPATARADTSRTSEFTQKIELIDCTVTNTEDGSGGAVDTRCDDAILPTVYPLKTTNRRPIIHGTYAAAEADSLRVFVNGIWYQLGHDTELSISGNQWRLDLAGGSALAIGSHNVIAEVLTNDGLLLRDNTDQELMIREQPSGSGTDNGSGLAPEDDGWAVLAPQSGEPRIFLWVLGGILGMLVVSVTLLMAAYRHRRSEGR